MDLLNQFQQNIREEELFLPIDSLLLAVSGGVDSVVLCHLCLQSGFNFSIAHCNFGLRDKESDGDEQFVKGLAKKYGVPFYVKKFDTKGFAAEGKYGIQEAARILRYEWFESFTKPGDSSTSSTANSEEKPFLPIKWILTAHHADDNIETVLMNFFRGTGIYGLKGIRAKKDRIRRPLLFAYKAQINSYALENQLEFREDSSNKESHYTRNYFRNEMMPELEKIFPQVKHNLYHNIPRFQDIQLLYDRQIAEIKKKLMVQKGNEWHIPVLKLAKAPALHTICFEIIRHFGFTAHQVDDFVRLLKSQSGKFIFSASHRILHDRKWMIISPLDNLQNSHYLLEKGQNQVQFNDCHLTWKIEKYLNSISPDPVIAQVDASLVEYPLLLRKWRKGDYFYPLGMKKKKKLSRFFIDQKFSLAEKDRTWVIESGKKILWIVGHRIDERFRLTEQTKEMLIFKFSTPK